MLNNWRTYPTEVLTWELEIPGQPGDSAIRRWERAALDSAEKHAVFQVQTATGRASAMDYRRDRDGYLGDVLDAHPEYLTPPDQPEELLFRPSLLGTSRLAYVDIHDQIREANATYLTELPELKSGIGRTEVKPPLQFMAGAEPSHIWVAVSSYSSIWSPWELNDEFDDEPPEDAFLDNRPLAERHTPRLNAFLADLRDATREAGGWFRLDRSETSDTYIGFVDDHGVRLDAPAPAPPPTDVWP